MHVYFLQLVSIRLKSKVHKFFLSIVFSSLTKWIWRLKCWLGTRPTLVRARPALVVVVSGCDSGLGFQLARAARSRGLTVVAGLLQGPQGPGGRSLGVAKDPQLHLVQLDVTSEESVDSLKDYVEKLLKDNPDYGKMVQIL